MIESLTQPHETRNKRRWLAHPFRLRVCSCKIKLHSEHSLHFSKFAMDILKGEDFMEISIQRRSQGDGIPSTADTDTRNSASACKIPLRKQSESSNRKVPSTDPSMTGFRLVNMEILNSVFRILQCKENFECSFILREQAFKRKGCTSHLRLFCVSCGWVKDFVTSLKVPNQRFSEVNRRLVYGMRSIGCGHFR